MGQGDVLELLAKCEQPMTTGQIAQLLHEIPYNHVVQTISTLFAKKSIDRLIMPNRQFRYQINETGKQELARRNIIR